MVKELPLPKEANSDRKTLGGFAIFLETAHLEAKVYGYSVAALLG